MLRSIRKIKGSLLDPQLIENLFDERKKVKKLPNSDENISALIEINKGIIDNLFVPEYITILIEHPSHYKHLYEKGFYITLDDGDKKKYKRFSCSASQARNSTVVFVEETIADKLKVILDNGRDLSKPLTPSKFNAYFGVSGSATKVVSDPRFCVVPDYFSNTSFMANFVTETNWEEDDFIEPKLIDEQFNRFDGMGLISYEKAKEWAEELGLDYVPSQWCVRQNYVKGLLCTFPIHEFCETENNQNYNIQTIYKDDNGKNRIIDIRNCDVILSESMFKLWDSFDSVEAYQENCKANDLKWGVALHTPKEDKDVMMLNYQFIQTLQLNKKDIETLCRKFVDWISGVTSDNIYYTLLFLLGKNTTEDKILNFLKSSENHWLRCLLVDHELIKDKYIKDKIYGLIKKKIKRGCLGEVIVDGNFQTLVSDPYAMMQHICGKEVTGLLGKRQYYSNYWNKKNIKTVDSMRSPLTYRSEHLKLNIVENEKMNYWYRYCNTGIIVNVHGCETVNWSGSDFDYDIIATTSDPTIIKGIYEDELPITYSPPKPEKIVIKDDRPLYEADLFAFGSAIGSITNKSTTGYALLPLFEQESEEYKVLMNRIRMCTKLQNAQIDKAKIGKKVKGIPKRWVDKQKEESYVNPNDADFYNRINMKRHPYFFTYLYKDTKKLYSRYFEQYNVTSKHRFLLSLNDLIKKERKTLAEKSFLEKYYEGLPVIDSDCVMNNLCRHIESIDFSIKEKIKKCEDVDFAQKYTSGFNFFDEITYGRVREVLAKHNKIVQDQGNTNNHDNLNSSQFSEESDSNINNIAEVLKGKLENVCSNEKELTDYLIHYFYVDKVSSNKDLLWNLYGHVIFENIKKDKAVAHIPLPKDNGEINYLNKQYKICEVRI